MAYVNHAVLVESTAEMHRPTPARKFTLIAVSSSLVTVIYVLVSVCGYLHHGNAVDQNILNSEPKDALFASARIAVAFVVSLSYPLVCAPARLCLDWLVAESYRRDVPRVGDGAALLVAVSDDGGVEDGSNDSLPMASYVNASVETERWRWIRTRVLHAASWDWHDPTIASWRFYAETVFITVMSLFIAVCWRDKRLSFTIHHWHLARLP